MEPNVFLHSLFCVYSIDAFGDDRSQQSVTFFGLMQKTLVHLSSNRQTQQLWLPALIPRQIHQCNMVNFHL